MNKFKKLVSLLALSAMVFANSAHSTEYYDNCGGCGYEECRRAPCIAPAVALGAIALAAIIAVALQNSSCHHGHGGTCSGSGCSGSGSGSGS